MRGDRCTIRCTVVNRIAANSNQPLSTMLPSKGFKSPRTAVEDTSAYDTSLNRLRHSAFISAVAERAMSRLAIAGDAEVLFARGEAWRESIETNEIAAVWHGPASALGVLEQRLRTALNAHADALVAARSAAMLGVLGAPPGGGACEPAVAAWGTMADRRSHLEMRQAFEADRLKYNRNNTIRLSRAESVCLALMETVPGAPITRAPDAGARVMLPAALTSGFRRDTGDAAGDDEEDLVFGEENELRRVGVVRSSELRVTNEGASRGEAVRRAIDDFFVEAAAGTVFWEEAFDAAANSGGGAPLAGALVADAAFALGSGGIEGTPLSCLRVLVNNLGMEENTYNGQYHDIIMAVLGGAESLVADATHTHSHNTHDDTLLYPITPPSSAVAAALDAIDACVAAPAGTLHCRVPLRALPLGWAFMAEADGGRHAESIILFSAQPAASHFADALKPLAAAVATPMARHSANAQTQPQPQPQPFLGGLRLALRVLSLGGALARAVEAEVAALKAATVVSSTSIAFAVFDAVSARGQTFFSAFCDNIRQVVSVISEKALASSGGEERAVATLRSGDLHRGGPLDAETAAREAVRAGIVAAASADAASGAFEALATKLSRRLPPTSTSSGARTSPHTPVLAGILSQEKQAASGDAIVFALTDAAQSIANTLKKHHAFIVPSSHEASSATGPIRAIMKHCSRGSDWECACSCECATIARALREEAATARARCADCECQNIKS